jgi:hypothetical protein
MKIEDFIRDSSGMQLCFAKIEPQERNVMAVTYCENKFFNGKKKVLPFSKKIMRFK